MSTMSINATKERPGTQRGRLGAVPWLTVLPLAAVLAYADGIVVVALRGAVGSIERTQAPVPSWLVESTLALPVFVLAVLGALTLGGRWFGPVLRKSRTVVATMMLVVAAGTLVGVAALAASSAYDYHLQTSASGMHQTMSVMGNSQDQSNNPALALQVRSVGAGSGMLLATNLLLVGWMVAMRGGRLAVIKTRD